MLIKPQKIEANLIKKKRSRDLHTCFGGIFRDENETFLGAFAHRAALSSAIDVEVLAIMEAIKVTRLRGWLSFWIETDSMLVVSYFHKPTIIL